MSESIFMFLQKYRLPESKLRTDTINNLNAESSVNKKMWTFIPNTVNRMSQQYLFYSYVLKYLEY